MCIRLDVSVLEINITNLLLTAYYAFCGVLAADFLKLKCKKCFLEVSSFPTDYYYFIE